MMDSFRAEDTTLPILGIQKLGETPGRHVVLEGWLITPTYGLLFPGRVNICRLYWWEFNFL